MKCELEIRVLTLILEQRIIGKIKATNTTQFAIAII